MHLFTTQEQGRLSSPEAMVHSPKTAGWDPQFLIIMHLKCCADGWHDLPVFDNYFETKVLFLMYFGSQIINEYYDDANNGRMAD